MKRNIATRSLLLFTLSFGVLSAQERSQDILVAQDSRNSSALREYMASIEDAKRAEALLAAGSVQDTSLIEVIAPLLFDRASAVRKNAALALGQLNYVVTGMQRSGISSSLIGALEREMDESVILRIVEALGKVGTAGSLENLTAFAQGKRSEVVMRECALTVGRYGYRGIRHGEATMFVVDRLGNTSPAVQLAAAYAIRRIETAELLEEYDFELRQSFAGGGAEVRRELATAMGSLRDRESFDLLVIASISGEDWKVRVNAVKSMARYPYPSEVAEILKDLGSDADEHVSLTALGALQGLSLDNEEAAGVIGSLLWLVENSGEGFSQRRRDAAALALISIRGDKSPDDLLRWGAGRVGSPTVIAGLGLIGGKESYDKLLQFTASNDPIERRLALEAIQSLGPGGLSEDSGHENIREVFISALADADFAVMTAAASALGDSVLRDPASLEPMIDRLKTLSSAEYGEAMVEMIRTIGLIGSREAVSVLEGFLADDDRSVSVAAAEALIKITGTAYQAETGRWVRHADYDWDLLRWISDHPIVAVETSAGTFSFEMLPDEAPFTCLNFVRLVRQGFYNGLIFHRVVPNFVIQGGDPHGDGWGGPGYSIRSEFGLEHYERGTVGVASAGKDTEGCQFFVTHSPQPHLDGRYTIFGQMSEGMETVDAIQVGDRIVRINLAEGK